MLGSNTQTMSLNIILLSALVIVGGLSGLLIAAYGFSPIIAALPFVLIFLILTVIKPWIALVIFFVLVPLEYLIVLEGDFNATGSKMIGAYLVFLVLITGRIRYITEVFKHNKTLWILGFLLAALISTIFSDITIELFNNLQRLFIFTALYIVLISMIRDMKTLRYCITALVVGAVISVISPVFMDAGNVEGIDFQRFGGLWGDQNEFAAILLFTLPLSAILFQYSKRKLMRFIYGISFILILTGFLLTYSRGGFIAFMVLFLLASYRIIKSKHRTTILAILIPTIIILSAVFYNTIAENYISRIETLRAIQKKDTALLDGSISNRYRFYFVIAPELIKDSPIVGVGPGAFIHYNTYTNQTAHNTYIEVLTGMGILGFIPFMAILFLTWKELRKTRYISKAHSELKIFYDYSIVFELGYVALLVCAMFISLDLNKILWLSITLSTVLANILRIRISQARSKTQFSHNL